MNVAVACFDGHITQGSIVVVVCKAVVQGVIADCMVIVSILKYTAAYVSFRWQQKEARQNHRDGPPA